MRNSSISRTLAVAAALFAVSALALGPGSLAALPQPASMIGKPIPDFKLPDFAGKTHSLSQYGDAKGVVLIFVSTRCPVSNDYNERMTSLAADYQPKGFQFLGVNANKAEDKSEMASHAAKHSWNFPVLKDDKNAIADRFGATVTPEVFLIDSAGVLRYHGRIDDSQDPSGIKNRDLREALDAILSGKEIKTTEAKAFGCSIKRV